MLGQKDERLRFLSFCQPIFCLPLASGGRKGVLAIEQGTAESVRIVKKGLVRRYLSRPSLIAVEPYARGLSKKRAAGLAFGGVWAGDASVGLLGVGVLDVG